MHELSIAMSIIELCEEEAERRGASVTAVHLKLGKLSGVVRSALESAYGLACEGTGLEGSRLIIEEIPVLVYCPKCLISRPLPSIQWFVCPECQTPVSEVLEGRELLVTALEIDTPDRKELEVHP
jgi:hydrogenase nickel incorporation protein HypA/HybF